MATPPKDVLKEIDGSTGLLADHSNVPDGVDWPAHTERLRTIATSFA